MVFDLNAPPTTVEPPAQEDGRQELPFHVGDVYDLAEELTNDHKDAMGLVFHEASYGVKREGVLWGISVLDLASQYSWCPSVVLSAAKVMADLGFIQLTTDTTSCSCDACVANVAYISLPMNAEPLHRILWARHERDVANAQRAAHQIANTTRSRQGFVYLIRCGPRHKIGITNDMNRRMDQLRGQSPYPLEVVHYAQGRHNTAMESRLHERFAEHRVHGEWFEFSPEQIAAVIEAMNDWQREEAR